MLQSRKVSDLHPVVEALSIEHTLRANKLFIARGHAGVTMYTYATLRDKEFQQYCYNQGRTKPGNIITRTLNSPHLYGVAYDAAPVKNGNILWNREDLFRIIVEAGKGLKIDSRFAGLMNSGGNWNKFTDWPHHEFLGGLSYADYAKGKRPVWWGANPLRESITTKEPKKVVDRPYRVGVVASDALNVRSTASAQSKIEKTLKKGDRVRTYGIKTGFYDVGIGWMSTKYIKLEKRK